MSKYFRQGFTIIEWLVSFFITIVTVTLAFQFASHFYCSLLARSNYIKAFTESYVALDHIARNISSAPSEKNKWDFLSQNNSKLCWYNQEQETNIGYSLEKQNLYFTIHTHKNMLAKHIKDLRFTPHITGNQVKCITCEIMFEIKKSKNNKEIKTLKRIITLKNRVLE